MKTAQKKTKKNSPVIISPKKQISSLSKTKKDHFPVVALGASAGGLEAFELFFTHIPKQTGMAYIVITHLDRDHVSMMADLINKYTPMTVLTIVDGVKVMPDTVYVIPPRKNVIIENGTLSLVEQSEPHYSNLPINYFLRSLALDRAENAAAIILSGAGADGLQGARDIKLHGGIVIAQDPLSAKFDSMPTSVINTGNVDFILAPELIPEQLVKWANSGDVKDGKTPIELQQIFTLIRLKTGYDFSSYKLNTICRRIERQMHILHLKSLAEYVLFLRKNPDEVDILYKSLLIGVTRFFRDDEAYEVLQRDIIPEIFNNKPLDYSLRIWVPGCSSGEEVYSIAITMAEYMDAANQHCYIQIFGTDIDTDALTIARSGVYPDAIKHDVSPERLKRFFTKEKNTYKIKKEIRNMVIFGEQNVIKDPPFTKVDLISCRNLLIYLNASLQKKILPVFHYSLKPNGILFLGMSESIAGFADLFESINNKAKFFKKKSIPGVSRAMLGTTQVSHDESAEFHDAQEKVLLDDNSDSYLLFRTYLLDKFVSPYVLINSTGNILFYNDKVNQYLRFTTPHKNINIFDAAHPNIKSILRSALGTAILEKKEVAFHGLSLTPEADFHTFNLKILPLTEIKLLRDHYLVVFEELSEQDVLDVYSSKNVSEKKNKSLAILERELRYTKENLQATIEELESSNEELQSMNEELQSTNEELETSKEELHSLNEELIIMNTELQNRIDQLAIVYDDMTNLFNSTEIATLFLDNKLCVKRFTPKSQEYFHLITTDVGRSIRHFATNIKYERLAEDAEEVLKTLNQKVIEVKSKSGRWLLVRILPYRTISNMIDGVIITLTDITDHKEAEEKLGQLNVALQDALNCSKNIIDMMSVPMLVLSTDLKIISANRAFYKNFQLFPEDVIGKFIYNISVWNMASLRTLLEQNFQEDNVFEGVEIETGLSHGGRTKLNLSARKIFNNESGADVILLSLEPK